MRLIANASTNGTNWAFAGAATGIELLKYTGADMNTSKRNMQADGADVDRKKLSSGVYSRTRLIRQEHS